MDGLSRAVDSPRSQTEFSLGDAGPGEAVLCCALLCCSPDPSAMSAMSTMPAMGLNQYFPRLFPLRLSKPILPPKAACSERMNDLLDLPNLSRHHAT